MRDKGHSNYWKIGERAEKELVAGYQVQTDYRKAIARDSPDVAK